MPAFGEDYKKIADAQNRMKSASSAAADYDSGAETLRDMVMNDVKVARQNRGVSTIAKDLGVANEQLVSGGEEIRQRTDGIVNPLDVDTLTSRERAQKLGILATIARVTKEREGTVDDWINAGTNQLKAAAVQKKAEAQAAAEEADSILKLLAFKQSEEERKFNEYIQTEQLNLSKSKAGGSGSGSRSGDTDAELKTGQDFLDQALGLLGSINPDEKTDFITNAQGFADLVAKGKMTPAQAMTLLRAQHPIYTKPSVPETKSLNPGGILQNFWNALPFGANNAGNQAKSGIISPITLPMGKNPS